MSSGCCSCFAGCRRPDRQDCRYLSQNGLDSSSRLTGCFQGTYRPFIEDAWADNMRLCPTVTSLIKGWSAPASGFRPPQRDFCLHPAFEKLTKECKAFVDFGFACIASASAAAHAVSHASAYVQEFLKGLPDLLEDEENPGWVSFCTNAEKAVTSHPLLPLQDASR